MRSLAGPSKALTCVLLLAALTSLTCAGVSHAPEVPPAEGPAATLTHHVSSADEAMVFPPIDSDAREARPALPREYGAADAAAGLRVLEPPLDHAGAFHFSGPTFRVTFSEPMTRPIAVGSQKGPVRAAPGTISVTPAIDGSATWIDARTLEFKATQPFAENAQYEAQVGAIGAVSGRVLTPWKAVFTAQPSFVVAGKELGYLPKRGDERVIAMHPSDDRVSRTPALSLLFDQPIDLRLAHTLVKLEDSESKAVPFHVDHPTGPTFQGVKVDPRYVVLIGAAVPLERGKTYTLTGLDHTAEGRKHDRDFKIADALEETQVECGYYTPREETCRFEKGRLRMSGREVHVVFNNPIENPDGGKSALAKRVQISPKVRNLSVRSAGWDEPRLVLTGDFVSSTTYDVTIAGVTDTFGGHLAQPFHFKLDTLPLGASVAMSDGLVLLDQERTKHFTVTTRNVSEVELRAFAVADGAEAFGTALDGARNHVVPSGEPTMRIAAHVKAQQDQLVETEIDLGASLVAGKSYVITAVPAKVAYGAEAIAYPRGSEASEAPVALLAPADAHTLAVHARIIAGSTLVHVARLATGEPVAGASVKRSKRDGAEVTTDANGVAVLTGANDDGTVLEVTASDAVAMVPLSGKGLHAKDMFPELTAGEGPGSSSKRAMVISDRGIYRPGSTVFIKATVRKPDGDRLVATAGEKLRVRVVGPTGDQAYSEDAEASETGSVATKFAVPSDERVGRHTILLEDPLAPDPPLARTVIQIAEFEPPRFAVDVEMRELPPVKGVARVAATVKGRYLFGAPMTAGSVSWSLKREAAPFPSGSMTDGGLSFRREYGYFDEESEDGVASPASWARTGEGVLGEGGALAVEQAIEMPVGGGPQTFTLEADISDSSARHIAGRASVVRHSAKQYAGLKVGKGWVAIGERMPISLGVIDTAGAAVIGASVTARLERIEWHYATRRGPGGAYREDWSLRRVDAGHCTAKSAATPVTCDLEVPRSGEYEISAETEGRRGGSASFYAWRDGDDETSSISPHRGHAVAIAADKSRYVPGETAHLLVRSPFPAATAILTIEQGGLIDHKERRIQGGAVVFDLPITAAFAPFAHAAVTLLPIGAKGRESSDFRVGALRIPVASDASRLELALTSDRPSYEPGEEAELSVLVTDHGKPDAKAEIALSVVDEGVLRLTNFHPIDPAIALRPGRALSFDLFDARLTLEGPRLTSHIAGDGGGSESGTVASTRRDFVETALFRPDLRTDANGRASVKLKLPDNLTEFRMMAVVLDDDGKGAKSEASFTVKKPVMIVPIVPRFASVGDDFEAAVMVHNNTSIPFPATVKLGDRTSSVTVEPNGHARVAFPMKADGVGTMLLAFALGDANAKVLDRVEVKVPIEEPGIDERPRIEGAFAHRKEVALAIPPLVRGKGDASLVIQTGLELWPELGARMEYLLDYPHGCVEQTTSSTLPLIAARGILPRIGVTRLGDEELKTRIRAGLQRLVTMRTSGGGLAYWPGGDEPNVYGTAYAIRAVVLAQKGGIALPSGLLEGMQHYLESQLLLSSTGVEVQAAIAQSLAETGALPPSALDALYETRTKQSVFGLASLAIAFNAIPGQVDRVRALLDDVEASFDKEGALTHLPTSSDFYYYGSPTRSRAQAAIALGRLRRSSPILPSLLRDLAERVESYTTQSTAYSLLALSEQLTASSGGGAPVRVTIDGVAFSPVKDLGFGSAEYHVPLARLAGKKATLRLESDVDDAIGFLVSASWQRPSSVAGSLGATSAKNGPSVYRVYTDTRGEPVDLTKVKTGDVVRVALLARLPSSVERDRLGYLAITDRLPAGFEPINPDLASVASVPDLLDAHPFAPLLRAGYNAPSHVDLHDDHVDVYFDRTWGDEVAASYLVRASTPGEFTAPPAVAELMYEGDSLGYSEGAKVVVR